MTETIDQRPWDTLADITETGAPGEVGQYIESLDTGEAARALGRMEVGEQAKVMLLLTHDEAAALLNELPDAQSTEILAELPAPEAAAILTELPSNEQADLLAGLPDDHAQNVLNEIAPDEARDLLELASYPPDVAGGLMVTEYLEYPEDAVVGDVVADLHERADELADYEVQYIYVASKAGRLIGVLRLRDLVFRHSAASVRTIMLREPLTVPVAGPLDDLADFFDRHAFLGVPVVDEDHRMVGVVHRSAVEEALGDRSESDSLKRQGIVGGDEFRTMPLRLRAGRRLSWLSINIVLNIIAASVIAFFQGTLEQVIALAVFLPIISDMSGCSGNQAVAVSMRELALGLVRSNEVLYVWAKEIMVGLVNGLVLGTIIALVTFLWKGNAWLGLVVGAALAINTLVAVSLGGTVPLILRRLKVDPAIASGPILTTVTDMCGFFIALGFATLMLPLLTG
jgi:magnesium transporter